MGKFILIVVIGVVLLSMVSSCASPIGEEETVLAGDLVEDSFQNLMDDQDPSDLPQQNQTPSDDAEQEDFHEIESPSKDPSNVDDKEDETPNQEPAEQEDSNEIESPSKDPSNVDDKEDETPNQEPADQEESQKQEPYEEIDPEAEGTEYIKVLSYNLRGLRNGPTVNGERTNVLRAEDVAAVIKEIDADIVGMQELENFRERSGNFEQLPWLAEKCGYKYYYYVETCIYSDGKSSAGHGIMSKYPIKEYKEVVYDAQKGTAAASAEYGRFVLDINGKDVVFYNTHLLAGDSKNVNSIAAQQFRQILNSFYEEKGPAVMTGDFNLGIKIMRQIVDKSKLISMNGGTEWLFFTDKASIDNIYVRNVEPYFPTTQIGLYVGDQMGQKLGNAPPSDHDPVWSYFKFK